MQLESNAPETADQSGFSDLDRALVERSMSGRTRIHSSQCTEKDEAGEEMRFAWPEFLPAERIIPGMTEFTLNSLLILGLAALGGLYFLFFAL